MPRTNAPVVAVLSTATNHYPAELIDVSRTGARLKGVNLPKLGVDLHFQAEKVRAAGAVVWLEHDQCAVEFDTPIAADEVSRIRALSNLVTAIGRPASRGAES